MLVYAPIGRDGPASATLLRRAGIDAEICADYESFVAAMAHWPDAVFVAEEGLFGKPMTRLAGLMARQEAWSDLPFGHITDEHGAAPVAIHGLAVCRYADEARVYRFSCDAHWKTLQDAVYASMDEAREQLPAQYRTVAAAWHRS